MPYELPQVTLEEALQKLEKDARDPVYYHGRVAKAVLDYIRLLETGYGKKVQEKFKGALNELAKEKSQAWKDYVKRVVPGRHD